MATVTQTADAAAPSRRIAADMLAHAQPRFAFGFAPFLQTTYHHGLPADRPVCKAYSAGHCPQGARCPDRHVVAASSGGGGGGAGHGGFNSLVCKHWLRGLCKKGEGCEFLHEYNLRKMPECNFYLRNGYCSNGDECLYLHIDPRSKLPPCPDYDNRGFCVLGPACPKKHVRRALCPCYLAGFCPDGRACKAGAHPKWSPVAVVVPLPPQPAAAASADGFLSTTGDDDADYAAADYAAHDVAMADGTDPSDEYHPQYPHQQMHGDDDRDRPSRDYRGGFKDKFGSGGGSRGSGSGGRWRGRGGGHKFRGRGGY